MNQDKPIRTLESIDLSYCTILDKSFSGVKFNGANFRGARFNNVDFTGATFTNCDFTDSRLTDCQLDHAQAHMTEFSLVIFENCSVGGVIGGFVLAWRLIVAVWYVPLTVWRLIQG